MSTATATKERPILFNGEMVRAILDGRKTQTRRIVKPQPSTLLSDSLIEWVNVEDNWKLCGNVLGLPPETIGEWKCPFGRVGDRLWVRETCKAEEHHPTMVDGVRYSAGNAFHQIDNTQEASDRWVQLNCYRGKRGATVPSIHMPRWASRISLEITKVRVERLNDISEADAESEGVEQRALDPWKRTAFCRLWETINGEGSWDVNPWVWVVEFVRID